MSIRIVWAVAVLFSLHLPMARTARAGDPPDPPIAVPKLPRFQPLLSFEQGWLMLRLHSPQALAQSPETTELRR